MGYLDTPHVDRLLRDRYRLLRLLPHLAAGFLQRKTFAEIVRPESLEDAFISVPRKEGMFLYLTARAIGARTVVEFGTSFGISTIYLGAAVVDSGGGQVIGSELLATKHTKVTAHLRQAGLSDLTEVRLGDALTTLRDTPAAIDLVFLDDWKELYLPVLKLLTPWLLAGALVLADNIFTFKKSLRGPI